MSQENERSRLFDDLWEIVKQYGDQWECVGLSDLRYNRRLL